MPSELPPDTDPAPPNQVELELYAAFPRKPQPRPRPAPPPTAYPIAAGLAVAQPTPEQIADAWTEHLRHVPGPAGLVCLAPECGIELHPCQRRRGADAVLRAAGRIGPQLP